MYTVLCGCSMVQLFVSYTGKRIQHVCEYGRFKTNSAGSPRCVGVGVAGW